MDEELVQELIEVIWPRLDSGVDKDDVRAAVQNVLDAWTPVVG